MDANRNVDEVFTDVMKVLGELPPKEKHKVKKKKTMKVKAQETEWVKEWETFSGQMIVFVLGM